ncbi:MAG: histidine--tRNA ligase [Deltaproteobacteria bacterium]|nr:histidine--tRNA ligase [Deltaproteobacteria bacterium]
MGCMVPQVLKGFRDYLPEVMIPRQRMLRTIADVFESFGYLPLETPALEYAELLTGKYGEEGEGLLYRFRDHGGREVALRYDLTVPLARVIGSHPEIALPFKRYQIGPVWRAEKPGRGRFREFVQCDVDILGSSSMLADCECLLVDAAVLRALGVERFRIRVNNRKLLNGLLAHYGVVRTEAIHQTLRQVDKLEKVGRAAVADLLVAEAGWERPAAEELLGLLAQGSLDFPFTNPSLDAGRAELQRLLELAAAAGITSCVELDPTIARGLDYYTGTVFETVLLDLPGFGSVMSGGRYDELVGLFRSQPLAAVGISLGVDRLLSGLLELGLLPLGRATARVLLAVFGPETAADSVAAAQQLRAAGISTEVHPSDGGKLGKQYKHADSRGIPVVALIGPDEAAAGRVRLKRLATGEEITVARAELAARVAQWLG